MRTFRKVLCILCLAALITSSAALAAPMERSDVEARSLSSWALSLLDSIMAYFAPDEYGGVIEPNGQAVKTGQSEPGSPDEFGGVLDPNGTPQTLDTGDDPPDDEFGGAVDPNG